MRRHLSSETWEMMGKSCGYHMGFAIGETKILPQNLYNCLNKIEIDITGIFQTTFRHEIFRDSANS